MKMFFLAVVCSMAMITSCGNKKNANEAVATEPTTEAVSNETPCCKADTVNCCKADTTACCAENKECPDKEACPNKDACPSASK